MARKRTKTAVQLELKRRAPRTWGGWRGGAGRPTKEGSEKKGRRQRFSRATVCHVTIKVRKGSVFCERYHARLLKTPTEVRNALRYALLAASRSARARSDSAARRPSRSDGEGHNRRHHVAYRLDPAWVDPLSTARWFDGYRDRDPDDNNPMPRARTFLLATGWRRGRGGCFRTCDVPGSGSIAQPRA